MEFYPKWKLSKYIGTCYPLKKTFLLSMGLIVWLFFLIFISLKMASLGFRVPFVLQPCYKFIWNSNQILERSCDVFESLLCRNIFHSLDILSSTPSFQIWSREQFCTTTYSNISLKLPPKLWDVNRSISFNIKQKNMDVLWNIWVNQPLFHSGPAWWFVQQPPFNLPF